MDLLQIVDARGRTLCDPWPLSTLPLPSDSPNRVRLLIYSCAGGHDILPDHQPTDISKHRFLTVAVRRRGAGRNYPHFLIFALHLFAAFFGVQAIADAIGFLSGSRIVAGALGAASVLYVLTYMTLALSAVYGGTRRRAVADTIIIAVFYWFATVITAVAILLLVTGTQASPGSVMIDDPAVSLPGKNNVYYSIEGLISHFKIIMEGIHVPPGECYQFTEAANGELGFYLVSDGGGRAWKARCRPPCFIMTSTLDTLLKGRMMADLVPIFDSLNMIGGECDR